MENGINNIVHKLKEFRILKHPSSYNLLFQGKSMFVFICDNIRHLKANETSLKTAQTNPVLNAVI